MDQQSQSMDNKIEYYRRLFDNKDNNQSSLIDSLADKLLGTLDFEVLDFEHDSIKEVCINQIRLKEKVLRLRKPIRIVIEKSNSGFVIIQTEINLIVSSQTFKEAICIFQEELFNIYKKLQTRKDLSLDELSMKKFFDEYIQIRRA